MLTDAENIWMLSLLSTACVASSSSDYSGSDYDAWQLIQSLRLCPLNQSGSGGPGK